MNKQRFGLALILAILLAVIATSALAAYSTLRYGDSGSAVKKMQTALVQLGYNTGGIDSRFGPTTEKAVRQFQKDNKLAVDGKAGNATLTLLYQKADGSDSSSNSGNSDTSSTGSSYFSGNYNTLKYGSKGSRVTLLQKALNQLGYDCGKADGSFGAGTQKAVKNFQKKNGLDSDGYAGKLTLKKIEALLAGGSSSNGSSSDSTDSSSSNSSSNTGSATGVPTRTLRKGSTGNDVKSVQTRLKELKYYTGSIDGSYGNGTLAAVKAFQKNNGLSDDGIAGSATYKVLFSDKAKAKGETSSSGSSSSNVPDRTLRKGDTGNDVKNLQQRLKDLGYYTSIVDGSYGSGTVNAVKAFQKQHNLDADGVAGSGTCSILFSDKAQKAEVNTGSSNDGPADDQPSATAPEGGWKTLKRESSGVQVTQLQNALKQLGYTVEPTSDKVFDYTTMWAVQCFQRRNGLKDDGIAGASTQQKLYGGSAVGADTVLNKRVAKGVAPGGADVELLHWYDDIKTYLKNNRTFTVYDPATKKSWQMRLYSAGAHADSEPLTAADSKTMYEVWGNKWTWNEKPVYVKLANGTWCLASMPNMPHLSGGISNNDFEGHTCVHFPRNMTEVQKNDPKNAARHNIDLRNHWRSLTGEDIPW